MPTSQIVRYRRKTDRGTNRQRERVVQVHLTNYLRYAYPNVDFYNDWSSGAFLTGGQNRARMSLASRNGWCDLFIPEPQQGFHGLFIELKREDARVYLKDGVTLCSDPQIRLEAAFLERQRAKGYAACFARGLDEAKRIIDEYFGRPTEQELPF